jgi:hypothetical protein
VTKLFPDERLNALQSMHTLPAMGLQERDRGQPDHQKHSR